MTFEEIYLEVIRNFVGKETTDATLIARVKLWINARQRKICEVHNFYFMEEIGANIPTVDGTQSYSLTTPCPSLKELRTMGITTPITDTTITPLTKTTIPDPSKYFITGGIKNKPTEYWLEGDKLYLYPTPDAVYTLYPRYYKYLADLSVVGDTNEITLKFPQVLIAGATADGMEGLKEEAGNWEQQFQAGALSMIAADNRRRNQDSTIRYNMRIK